VLFKTSLHELSLLDLSLKEGFFFKFLKFGSYRIYTQFQDRYTYLRYLYINIKKAYTEGMSEGERGP